MSDLNDWDDWDDWDELWPQSLVQRDTKYSEIFHLSRYSFGAVIWVILAGGIKAG